MRATAAAMLLLASMLGWSTWASADAADPWGVEVGPECCLDMVIAPDHREVLLLASERSLLRFTTDGVAIGRIPVRHAVSLAISGDRLFVLSDDPVRVFVLDLGRLEDGVVEEIALDLGGAGELTAAAGSLWASGPSDRHPLGEVVRIDPDRAKVVESFASEGLLIEARPSDRAVWVLGSEGYCRILPGAKECWPLPGLPSRFASFLGAPGAGGEWLYVVEDGVLTRLLPGGGEPAPYAILPASNATLLAASEDGQSVAATGFAFTPGAPDVVLVGEVRDSFELGGARLLLLEWGADEDRLYAATFRSSSPVRFGVLDHRVEPDTIPPRPAVDPNGNDVGSAPRSVLSFGPFALAFLTWGVLSVLIQLVPVTRPAPDEASIRRGRRDAARFLAPEETVEGHVFGYQGQSVGRWLATTLLLWALAFLLGLASAILTGNPPLVALGLVAALVFGYRLLLHHMLRPCRVVLTDRRLLLMPVHPLSWRPSGVVVEVPRGAPSAARRRGMTTWATLGVGTDPLWVPPFWAQELGRIADAEQRPARVPARPDR